MRLLITGVSGFVGAWLARLALERGDAVAGACLGDRPVPAGVDFRPIDVLDGAELGAFVESFAPDAVVHLAALSHVGQSWQRMADYFRVNVLGTERVLVASAGVPRVVVASSAEVYGVVPESEQPIVEEREPAPASPYALTKAAAERLAIEAGAVVVRSFNLLGAGQSPGFALPSFARQLAAIARGEREPVLRVGNLSARRDFVHAAAGAAGYRLLAERGEAGEVYNLASGEASSIEQMLTRLMSIAGVEARIETDPERLRPVDVPLLCGDAARLRALGWAPQGGAARAGGGGTGAGAGGADEALAELWREACEEAAA